MIAPSLPGFAFSSPLEVEGMFFNPTADLWVKLMDSLGYDRFATQGGDIGAFVSARLGHKYADRVTNAMLYWLTDTYASSARHYYEARPDRTVPIYDRQPPVEAPTALLQFKGDVWLQPRKWAERYYNLKRLTVAQHGGHFAPMEQPEALVDDIRAFFAMLRDGRE